MFAAEPDPSELITNYPQVEATLPELLKLIENINALDDKRAKLVDDFRNYGNHERCKLLLFMITRLLTARISITDD